MRSWSISAGRIFGVEIRIHLTFLFLLAFVWLTEFAAHGKPPDPGRGLALVAIVLAAVLLHELGHGLVAVSSGVRMKAVILLPIGGVALLDESYALANAEEEAQNCWRDIRVASAGLVVSFVVAALSAAIIGLVRP